MALSGIKPQEGPDKQLRFAVLLAEISTFFINLPADRIDSEIEIAQRRVCEFLDLDRSTLGQSDEGDPETVLLTHLYQPPEARIPPERMSLKELFPWSLTKVLRGETVVISKMADLPAEAGKDRETFGLYGTKSVVVVPLSVGRREVFALLTFAVIREEREWTETLVRQFKLVAQIFANALARERYERELVKSEQRLRMITNALPVLIAYVDADQHYRFNNEAYREWFGVSPEEALGRHIREVFGESFFQEVKPYVERVLSGERVRCALNLETAAGRPLAVEATY